MKRIRQTCLLIGMLLCGAASAQIDTVLGGTATPTDFYTRYTLNSASSANVTFIADPAGSGRTVLSTTVRNTDAPVGGLQRTDIAPRGEALATGVRWYGLSVYLPSDWVMDPNPTVIAQIDNSNAGGGGIGAPLSLLVRGNTLELNLNSNYLDAASATPSNSAQQVIKLGPVVTNRWYCLVVSSDWEPTLGIGSTTMWMNGEKVYNAGNSTNSYMGAAQTPRVGVLFPGLMGNVTQRTVITDFIRLGGPSTNASQMYAVGPCGSYISGGNIQW